MEPALYQPPHMFSNVEDDPVAWKRTAGVQLPSEIPEPPLTHVLLFDAEALKNPGAHVSHVGWAVLDPALLVYFPGGHVAWAVHHSKGHPIAE